MKKWWFVLLPIAVFAQCTSNEKSVNTQALASLEAPPPIVSAQAQLSDSLSAPDEATLAPDTLPPVEVMSPEYLMGKFTPSARKDFILIDKKYAVREGMYMRKEAYQKFIEMYTAAEKEGLKLTILSATRTFYNQKNIWETKWKNLEHIEDTVQRALKILEYSSMPGSSRHHWGTDIDMVNLTNSYFEKNGGKKIYDWLVANAPAYGFCQPYTAGRQSGYHEEKWHWTYLPLSKPFTEYAKNHLKNEMISGFKGAATSLSIDIVNNYVLGINPACR